MRSITIKQCDQAGLWFRAQLWIDGRLVATSGDPESRRQAEERAAKWGRQLNIRVLPKLAVG